MTQPVLDFADASCSLGAFLYLYDDMQQNLQPLFDQHFAKALNTRAVAANPYCRRLSDTVIASMTPGYIAEYCIDPLPANQRLGIVLSAMQDTAMSEHKTMGMVRQYFSDKQSYLGSGDAVRQAFGQSRQDITVKKPVLRFGWSSDEKIRLEQAAKTMLGSPLLELVADEVMIGDGITFCHVEEHDEEIADGKYRVVKKTEDRRLGDYLTLTAQARQDVASLWQQQDLSLHPRRIQMAQGITPAIAI